MPTQAMPAALPPASIASHLLRSSAVIWFVAAAAGQLVFAIYIASLYGSGTLLGDMDVWNAVMRHGHVDGDPTGNVTMTAHVLLAFFITIGGLVQLTPQIRNIFPTFHRWNGRVYLTLASFISLAGLFLIWTRAGADGLSNDLAISLNGVLILLFAAFTVRHAIARHIDTHRRWATRLFLAVSGVWFLRIMVSGWITIHQAPLWLGENLNGPMGVAISFSAFLFPLTIYELYLRASDGDSTRGKFAMAATLTGLAILTAFGGFAATMIFWLPHL